MVNINFVTTCGACLKVVENILYNGPTTIAMTCKRMDIEQTGDVTLVAIATSEGQVFVFDVKANKKLVMEGGIWRIIESNHLLKVYHDCRADSASLKRQFGVKLTHVFDTQAAYGLMMEERGLPRRLISLVDLYAKFGDPAQKYQCPLLEKLEDNGLFWGRRPVSREMLNSLAMEVLALLPAVYENIKSQIKPDVLPFVEKLSEMYAGKISKKKMSEMNEACPVKKAGKRSVGHLDKEQWKYLKNTVPQGATPGQVC